MYRLKFCVAMLVICFGAMLHSGYGHHTGIRANQYSSIPEISAQQLSEQLLNKSDVIIVNVLHKKIYKDCAIVGSISVPFDQLKRKSKAWSKHADIVVYCASKDCRLSRYAYHTLKKLGFTRVRAYEGGMREWYQLGLKKQESVRQVT